MMWGITHNIGAIEPSRLLILSYDRAMGKQIMKIIRKKYQWTICIIKTKESRKTI